MEVFEFFNSLLGEIFFFLPDSPFSAYLDLVSDITWLKWLNWFIPIDTFVAIGMSWLSAVGGYYAYQAILRWARAVE